MSKNCTDEELEQHSYAAGEHAAFERVVKALMKQAGESFARGEDRVADCLRDAARQFIPWQDAAERRLRAHIDKKLEK